ncbi:ABC transporter permease [Paenibacillus nasutitermitis]|uniref:Putative hemin transport system permease protein HrtB n=1 Tax=Paenibacillus nasutitermitis TaxID=1652958 RepID=A0A917DP98_9BACL|nr:ABC transporter permease [Paenibacillus nasutitermitis]GGD53411.1 ABC transporter permease [Paenibacillus nasutitermitis]
MYLALREMRFAKTRYMLIITIMLLVSFLVLFVTGLARGLAYANASTVKNMAADHFVVQKDADRRFTRSLLSEDHLNNVRSVVGEANAAPLNLRMTSITEKGESVKTDVTLFAVDMEGWLAPETVKGKEISNTSDGQILVDRKLEDSGVRIGTVLEDTMTGSQWTVSGFVNNESFSHTPSLFMNEQDWLKLQKLATVNGKDPGANTYNAIAVKTDKGQVDLLKDKLPDAEVISKSEAVSAVPGYKEEQGSLLMMIVFLFVISAMVLAVFFYVITIQKTSQFGILKAIGARTGYLARSVMGQVLLLSIGSLAISLLLIRVVYAVLPASMPFQLDSSTLILTCTLFIAMSLIGSLLSVFKIARTDALDAIGRTAG